MTTSLKELRRRPFPHLSGISAAGAILYYLEFTEHPPRHRPYPFRFRVSTRDYVWSTNSRSATSSCSSSNGGAKVQLRRCHRSHAHPLRAAALLKRWIAMPVKDTVQIRLDVVRTFRRDADLADTVREQVAGGRHGRIASRTPRRGDAPELVQLKNSLFAVELLKGGARIHGRRPIACSWRRRSTTMTDVRDPHRAGRYNPDPLNNQIRRAASRRRRWMDDLRRIAHGK